MLGRLNENRQSKENQTPAVPELEVDNNDNDDDDYYNWTYLSIISELPITPTLQTSINIKL